MRMRLRLFAVLTASAMTALVQPLQSQDRAGWLLVANKNDQSLGIIDPVSHRQVAAVPVGGVTGHEVAASPDGKRAFVPIFGNSGVGKPGTDGQHIATLLCALFLRHFRPLVLAGHVFVAMPPLFRIDVGKQVFYALDEAERQGILDRIRAENIRGKVTIMRFKGLGEMNPSQLRETVMAPQTRRLLQLTLAGNDKTDQLMDMLLAKKRASDRREWLEEKGNLAQV